MPELPEVETIRRQLAPLITGRRVAEAWGHESAKFNEAPMLTDTRFAAVDRRGKYLIIDLEPPDTMCRQAMDERQLVVHLGMTGALHVHPADEAAVALEDPYLRAWWRLDNDQLFTFRDVRRFGRLRVVPRNDWSTITTLHALGPEPFSDDFTADHLYAAVKRSRRRIKTQLLSQRPVAGVGNIYADEALWAAGVYPAARAITRVQAAALRDAIVEVLEDGVRHGGTTLRDYRTVDGDEGGHQHHLFCYGRSGEPCARCTSTLRSTVIDARTTTWCPQCQPRR